MEVGRLYPIPSFHPILCSVSKTKQSFPAETIGLYHSSEFAVRNRAGQRIRWIVEHTGGSRLVLRQCVVVVWICKLKSQTGVHSHSGFPR